MLLSVTNKKNYHYKKSWHILTDKMLSKISETFLKKYRGNRILENRQYFVKIFLRKYRRNMIFLNILRKYRQITEKYLYSLIDPFNWIKFYLIIRIRWIFLTKFWLKHVYIEISFWDFTSLEYRQNILNGIPTKFWRKYFYIGISVWNFTYSERCQNFLAEFRRNWYFRRNIIGFFWQNFNE